MNDQERGRCGPPHRPSNRPSNRPDSGPHRFWTHSAGKGWHSGPPWKEGWRPHGGDPGAPPWAQGWHHRRRFFFFRAIGFLGILALLVVGGMAMLAFLLTRVLGGSLHTTLLVWFGGLGLALGLPLLALGLGIRAVRRVAIPLTDILAAIDAVAAGDLSARVPERGNGEIARLSRSMNRMIGELERTDQQRRNLTADVAHELRTPLHIIQGNLEGVIDGVYAPTPEHIEITLEETRHLARLVDDLRTLSLAESGELPLVLAPVDVRDVIADVVTSLGPQAESAGIDLRIASEPMPVGRSLDPLIVEGDAGRLNQVLSNLVTNALHHTPQGGCITLAAGMQGDGISITVADTGEGIAAEDLPFVFDRFWRSDRARSHADGSGSGLGLAIAGQLVKAHGGEIDVASEVGIGTTFTVELPVAGTEPTGQLQ